MSVTHYICKYTPVELLEAFGGECAILNHMPDNFDLSDQVSHPNLCGFGKALLEAVMEGSVKELVLVNCCDTIRSAYGQYILGKPANGLGNRAIYQPAAP